MSDAKQFAVSGPAAPIYGGAAGVLDPPGADVSGASPEPAIATEAAECVDVSLVEGVPPASVFEVETGAAFSRLEAGLNALREPILESAQRAARLEDAAAAAAKQGMVLSSQMRAVAAKIDGVAVSISEGRIRTLLSDLVRIYDIVEQAQRTAPAADSESGKLHHRNYEVIATQLRQILTLNGLTEIPVEGPFDPELHRVVSRSASTDAMLANRIRRVVRKGFRTPHSVLRYAEVEVWYCEPVPATQA